MNPDPATSPRPRGIPWSDTGSVFEQPSTADLYGYTLLDGVLLLLLLWSVLRWRTVIAAFHGLGGRAAAAIVAVVTMQLVLVRVLVPHAPWHTNMHGFYKYIDIADAPWFAPPHLRVHGLGLYAPSKLLVHGFPAGWVSPYDAMVGMGTAALVAFAAWLWLTTGRRDVTVLGVLLLAFTPAHLRLTAADSYFIPFELFMVSGLVAWELYVRRGGQDTLAVAVALTGLAANCHLEFTVYAPMVLGLHAATRDPQAARRALRSPVAWSTAALLWSTRVVDPLLGASHTDMPILNDRGLLDTLLQYALPMTPGLLLTAAVLAVVWRGRARWSDEPGAMAPRIAWVVLGTVLVSPWVPGMAPKAYDGADRAYLFYPLHILHFVFNLNYTPALQPLLLLTGLAWLVRNDLRTFTRLVLPTVLMLVLYASQYDAVATYLRFGLAVHWLLVAVMAIAAGALLDAGGARLWPLLLLPAVVAPLGYARWIGWEYSTQTDYRVLSAAVAASRSGGALYTLTPDDFPTTLRDRFRVDLLGFAPTFLKGRTGAGISDATDLLAAPDDGTPRLWVRTASCFRAPLHDAGENQPFEILVGDRPVRVPERRGPTPPPMVWGPARSWEEWNADASLPCRHQDGLARCVDNTPDGCLAWQFPDSCGDTPPPFVQPACAAVEAAWVLEPVFETTVQPGRDSEDAWMVLRPDAVVGVYRVLRRRTPDVSAHPGPATDDPSEPGEQPEP